MGTTQTTYLLCLPDITLHAHNTDLHIKVFFKYMSCPFRLQSALVTSDFPMGFFLSNRVCLSKVILFLITPLSCWLLVWLILPS
jgi:hypothetical protein